MSQFIEQLESREYLSAAPSMSNPTYLDIQPGDSVITGQVNKARKEQFYLVRVMKAGEIDLRLEGLTGDATLELISDRNHNNRMDKGEAIMKSAKILAADESIRKTVAAGTQIRVSQADGNSIIEYSLRYSTQAFAPSDQVDKTGNDIANAREFSVPLGANRTVNEYVGPSDSADVYKMVVTQTTKYDIRLSGLVFDGDVTLMNANGEALATTVGKNKAAKLITGRLDAGTYYLKVNAVSNGTGYSLRVVGSSYRMADIDLTTKRVGTSAAKFSMTPITATIANLA